MYIHLSGLSADQLDFYASTVNRKEVIHTITSGRCMTSWTSCRRDPHTVRQYGVLSMSARGQLIILQPCQCYGAIAWKTEELEIGTESYLSCKRKRPSVNALSAMLTLQACCSMTEYLQHCCGQVMPDKHVGLESEPGCTVQ